MFHSSSCVAAALLVGGSLLAACGPQQPAEQQAAATATDKAADAQAQADTARQGATPRLLATFPDSLNTPDGLALGPGGRVLLSVPNLADNSYPPKSWS